MREFRTTLPRGTLRLARGKHTKGSNKWSVIYQKHIERARDWAKLSGTPEEVAHRLVEVWNSPPGQLDFAKPNYPRTSEFTGAIGKLITLTRKGATIESAEDKRQDLLCRACGQCKK